MKAPRSLGARLALTVLPVVALFVADAYVLAPGIGDLGTLRRMQAETPFAPTPSLGLFSLGVMAWVQAYVFVELVALAVPALRRLRHGNPEGRAKLDHAARVVGLVMVAFQAWRIATSLQRLGQSDILFGASLEVSVPVVTASLVGGACLSLLVADLVTRQGIVNGLLLLPCAGAVVAEIGAARAGYAKAMVEGTWEPRHFVIVLGVIAAAIFAGWAALRRNGAGATHAKGAAAYRDARALVVDPTVPVPSSSIVPFTLAASLVALPVTLANLGLPLKGIADALTDATVYYVALAVVTATLAFLLTRILQRPDESEDLARRLGTSVDRSTILAAQDRALVPTLVMFALLVVAMRAAASVPSYHVAIATLPVVAALAIDALRAIAVPSGFVAVWQERRALATPIVRAVLEARGIETRAIGGATHALFQAFAPYAPVTICVAQEHAERAEKILRHHLLGEEKPEPRADDAVAIDPREPAWSMRTRTIALGAALLVACGLVGLGSMKRARLTTGPRVASKLEVVAVEDSIDPIAGVDDTTLPANTEIRWENAPTGSDAFGGRSMARVHFVDVRYRPKESVASAIARGEEIMRVVPLPEGVRVVWEPTSEWDPDTAKETPTGVRSLLVRGEPILTNRDVVDAMPAVDKTSAAGEVYVAITLAPEAAERFRIATRENVNRRIAILLDGRATSAPVVRSEIGGGRLSITMGAGDPEHQLATARALADGLRQD